MRIKSAGTRVSAWMMAALVVSTGCRDHLKLERVAEAQRQSQELATLSAERDSLLHEVAENGKLVGDLAAELTKIDPPKTGEAESADLRTTLSDRDFIREKFKEVTARVKASERNLAQSQRRVRQLTQATDSLKDAVAYYQSAMTELQTMVDGQKATLALFTDRIAGLEEQNSALADTVNTLAVREHTAYYVVGSRAELLAKGLVVEEGGKFPLFGKRSLHPARELPMGEFTSIDTRLTGEIPLPRPDRKYRIVSRQSLIHLASTPDRKGTVSGSIQIRDSDEFWEPSKYLIVVEQ